MSPQLHRPISPARARASRRLTGLLAPLLCGALALGLAAPAASLGGAASAQKPVAEQAVLSAELTDYLADEPAALFRTALDLPIGDSGAARRASDAIRGTGDPADGRDDSSGAGDPDSEAPGADAPEPEDWVDKRTGRIEVLVYFTDPGVTPAAQGDPELAAAGLQRDAESHWDRVDRELGELTATGRVEVLNRFWITSAVLVSAEPSAETLADLAGLPGAIEVTPNYTVEALEEDLAVLTEPDPAGAEPAEAEPAEAEPAEAEPAEAEPAEAEPAEAEPAEEADAFSGGGTTVWAEAAAADAEAAAADAEATALAEAETPVTYGLAKIRADQVWRDFGARGQGVRVAVLDTGVDATHPDIGSRLVGRGTGDPSYPGGWINFDRSGKPLVTKPTDPGSHGTHVAGTVLGGDASGTSIGVAPEAELMAANVLSGGGSTAKLLAALEWTISPTDGTGAPAGRAADVINMSLGSGGFEDQLARALRNVRDAGIFPAVAIGNKAGTTSAPGNYFEAVAVGMTNADDLVDPGSSGGVMTWDPAILAQYGWPASYVKPDISAPGVKVFSAMPGGKFGEASGTSMASPHVAGAAALIRSAQAGLTVSEIESALEQTAWHPDPGAGPDISYGHGRIDVHAALSSVLGESGVSGRVVNASTGQPVAGAVVSYADRGETWVTDVGGRFTARIAPGAYELTVQRFGYETAQAVPATVGTTGFVELSIPLTQITVGSLSGTVLDHATSAPVAGAAVSVVGQELATTTDAHGAYRFPGLPVGSYQIRAVAEGKAESVSAAAPVKAALDTAVNFRLAALSRVLVLGDSGARTSALLTENGFLAESRTDVPDAATLASYDAVLWDAPAGDVSEAQIRAAIAATDASGSGIVWLDLGASDASGIATLSRTLGDPVERAIANDRAASAVGYRITAGHEILTGGLLSPEPLQPGAVVVQNSAATGPKYAAWFTGLIGSSPTVIAETVTQYTDTDAEPAVTTTSALGTGLAVDQRATNRHAYLALHGTTSAVDARNWSTNSVQLLLNTVKWTAPAASQAPEPEIVIPKPPVITPPVITPPVVEPPIVTPPVVTPPVVTPPRPRPPVTPGGGGSGGRPGVTAPNPTPPLVGPAAAPAGAPAAQNASPRAPGTQSAAKPQTTPAPPVGAARQLTKANAGGVTARVADGIAHISIPDAQPGDWFFLHVYPGAAGVDWIRANSDSELRVDVSRLTGGTYQLAFTSADEEFAGWVEVTVPGTAKSAQPASLVDEPTQIGPLAAAAGPPELGGLALSSAEQLILLGSALLILAAAGVLLFGPRRRPLTSPEIAPG